MRIRLKILLGYVLLAILVVVVGLVGYRATHSVGKSFDQAINQTQPVLQSLQEIRFHVVKLQADAHLVFHATTSPSGHVHAAGDDHRHDSHFDELDAAVAAYQELINTYFAHEADDAAEIVEEVGEFKEGIEAVNAAAKNGTDAHAALHELEERVQQVLEKIEEAAAAENREFSEYQHNVLDQVATQERMIAIAAVIAFLSAILGGARISQRVARPVIALRDAARKLGKGRFDTRVAVNDDTEVGDLANAFNSMAEQLASSMVSRGYVEDIIDSMGEGMIVVDRDGRIERVNVAFRNLYRSPEDFVFTGRPVAEFLPDAQVFEAAFSAGVARHWVETKMPTADGESLVVALSVASLQTSNNAAGAVVLVQDITERKRNEERLSYLARYDVLTSLPNRTLLLDHLHQSMLRQPWKKEHTAVLFCDLDRFKFINDTLGHCIGDILLQRVAERLQGCVRPGDVVARWSGDEFVIMLNDVAHQDDLHPVADKVLQQLSQPIQIGPHELYVTASVGMSIAPEHAGSAEELVKCADMAMFSAKADGKNSWRMYAAGMAERSQERLQLERSLRRALQDGGQLQVHYQAQKRLGGALIGFEALVRWQHPELGLISPANFLPAAEEAGLMAAIDETVMRMACQQARLWQDQGITGLRVSVNVSDHLFRRGDLPDLVSRVLTDFGLPASALELELTEAIVMNEVEGSIHTMQRLRAQGIALSIDDFGTGYSSLAHLKRCPIQMLKIDRSFVNDVMTDPSDAAITEAIAAMAHKMGIEVIAEGVETEEQLEALRRYGCDAIQGYWLSKPIPASMLPSFLERVGHPLPPAAAARKEATAPVA